MSRLYGYIHSYHLGISLLFRYTTSKDYEMMMLGLHTVIMWASWTASCWQAAASVNLFCLHARCFVQHNFVSWAHAIEIPSITELYYTNIELNDQSNAIRNHCHDDCYHNDNGSNCNMADKRRRLSESEDSVLNDLSITMKRVITH